MEKLFPLHLIIMLRLVRSAIVVLREVAQLPERLLLRVRQVRVMMAIEEQVGLHTQDTLRVAAVHLLRECAAQHLVVHAVV